MRSVSIFETIAVELIASAPPSTRPSRQPKPASGSAMSPASVVIATWASPSPNTARRMDTSWGRLNSSPSENIRNTMPKSARWRIDALSSTQPSTCGPTRMPATR